MIQIFDLTKPLDRSLDTYVQGNYRDPEFSCTEWSSVEKNGFRVSAISLGTQTGTHIDAPAHFDSAGKCLDALALEHLVGNYFLIDLFEENDINQIKNLCSNYTEEQILFVRAHNSRISTITSEALDFMLTLPPIVWVLDGEIKIGNAKPLEFHRCLAEECKYLVENLLSESARKVTFNGEIIILPLALVGTSGSPCRVVVTTTSV